MTYDSVCRQTVTVNLEHGLHLVPCSQIAQFARRHDCDVQISKDDLTVDAKNVLDLVTLKATHGTTLVLKATGDGAAEVVEGLVNLFESNFES